MRMLLCIALATSTASPVWAQTAPRLRAATALVAGKPEVRLRWELAKPGEVRLYRTDGTRRLVFRSATAPLKSRLALQLSSENSASDTQVAQGDKVSYELDAVDAAGKESPLATLKDFAVGADPQPPAPTGLAAKVEEGDVSLRWNRLTDAQEDALEGVSYRLQRDGKPLHKKPLVILDRPQKSELEPFFVDALDASASVSYRLTLVDGFGRFSAPVSLTMVVPDWRRPTEIPLVVAQLDELKPQKAALAQRLPSAKSLIRARRVEVTWVSASGSLSPIQYVVDRVDLDTPTAKPVRLTPQPIDGEMVPVTAALLDDLLGEPSWDAGEPTREQRLAAAKQRARLSVRLRTAPARRFVDTTIQPDRRYRYTVSALFSLNKLEAEPTASVAVDIPSAAAPAAVSGLSAPFTPTPPPSSERVLAPALAKQALVRPSLALRKALAPQRANQPLSFLARDEGGTVQLTWANPPGLVGVTCHITRKEAGGSVATPVLTTAPNATRAVDRLPRTGARRLTYQLTPISRWGVVGPTSSVTVEVPSTIAPAAPSVLSALPGEKGEVILTVQASDPLESVTEYVVRAEGKVVAHTAATTAGGVVLTVSGAARGRYTVLARNATARLDSLESEPVTIGPLATRPASVMGLRAQPTTEGVRLSWNPVPGASGYIVRRSTGGGAFLPLGGRSPETNITDVTVFGGRAYLYRVVVVDSKGNLSTPSEITITLP